MRTQLGVLALALLTGCPALHESPATRAQEAATDLNLNARFSRMEIAAESVSPKAKDAFFEHRRGWGGKVRVADYELTGLRMAKNDEDADVFVRVAWYRVDEGDLRVTTLKQKWHDFKGDWKLVDEAMHDGDVGLLGEPIPAPPPESAPRRTQFPTIHLGEEAPR